MDCSPHRYFRGRGAIAALVQGLGWLGCRWTAGLIVWGLILAIASPAGAGNLDPYVMRFLDASTPVQLPMNETGQTQSFSGADLSTGKRLFEDNCLTCHVGGVTLPNPLVPLSLEALSGATPPRTTISALASFIRQPMTYDGTEEELFCRQVSQSWMSDAEVEQLAAFLLRAAQKAPAWGTQEF